MIILHVNLVLNVNVMNWLDEWKYSISALGYFRQMELTPRRKEIPRTDWTVTSDDDRRSHENFTHK